MNSIFKCFIFLVVSVFFIGGCAPYKTKAQSFKYCEKCEVDSGLVYYLPKKDVVGSVTIEVDEDKKLFISAIGVTLTEPYPDYSNIYVLRATNSFFGDTDISFTVDNYGLMSTGTGKYTSQVTKITENLAESLGTISVYKLDDKDSTECNKPRKYSEKLVISGETSICGLVFDVKSLVGSENIKDSKYGSSVKINKDKFESGVYYRKDLPYSVSVKKDSELLEYFIFGIPNQSATYFIPAAKTFFANNESTITLDKGVLTEYKQTIDSEFVGATALPAKIIGKYFEAIGSIYTRKKSNSSSQTALITEELKLKLMMQKYEACTAAIATNKPELIAELKCGEN